MPSAKQLDELLKNYQAGKGAVRNKEAEPELFEDEPAPILVSPELQGMADLPTTGIGHGDIELGPMGEFFARANDNTTTRPDINQMIGAGWGKSRYDTRTGFYEGMNLEAARSAEQPGIWKIGNGAAKGVVTAATTALNTVAGTVIGFGSSLFELADQILTDKKFSLGQIVDAGVNNALSESMIKLQQLSEEWFPNYRSEAEQSEQYQREWYKHIGTANFIGDSFLKNFGFTVGAMVGGAAWSNLLGKMMNMKAANDLLRGAIAAAEGDAGASNALKEALRILKETGGRADTVVPDEILKNLKEAATAYRKMGAILQLEGATIAAMGEGTTEGIMAKNEFLDSYLNRIDQEYSESYQNIEAGMLEEDRNKANPEWFSKGMGYDNEGRFTYDLPILNEEGQKELARRQQEMAGKYQQLLQYADEQGDRLSSSTFLFNLPILTLTNTLEFGRMFSGGWKTARKAIANRGAVEVTEDAVKSTVQEAAGRTGWKAAGRTAKVGLAEMSEEMSQGFVSSGAKRVADARLTSFNDDAYDEDEVNKYREWLQGGVDYLKDVKNWQEGFLGLVTGVVGSPGIPGVAGRAWNGGIYEAVKSTMAEKQLAQAMVNKFNEVVNDPDFVNRWKGYIRHNKYNSEMEEAVKKDDQYAWHTADEKQLINDIMLFDELGRLNELEEIIDRYGKVSAASKEELDDIRKAIATEDKIEVERISNEQLAERVSKQAERMRQTVKEYREIYDEFAQRVPQGTEPDKIKELVFTATNMKRFEHRFLDMFGEVMQKIKPVLELAAKVGQDETEKTISFEDLYNQYAAFFTSALPRSQDVFLSLFRRENSLSALRDYVSFDEELQKKVDDMTRLMHDREQFYNKLIRLENLAPGEFDQKKKTPESESKKQNGERLKMDMKSMETLDDVKNSFMSLFTYKDKEDFIRQLDNQKNPPQHIKNFLDLFKVHSDFLSYANSQLGMIGLDPMLAIRMEDGLFENSSSKDKYLELDFSALPDSIAEKALSSFASAKRFNTAERAVLKNSIVKAMNLIADSYKRGAQTLTEAEQNQLIAELGSAFSFNRSMVTPAAPAAPTSAPPTMPVSGPAPGMAGPPPMRIHSPGADDEEASGPVPPVPKPAPAPNPQPVPKPNDGKIKPATQRDLVEDAASAVAPSEAERRADFMEGGKRVKNYLRTAIPEILLKDRDALLAALSEKNPTKRKTLLSGIVLRKMSSNPSYKKIYEYLEDGNAFENLVHVSIGDAISLVIDPQYEPGDRRPPIFLYSGDQLVGVLPSGTNRQYANIKELTDAVYDEYEKSGKFGTADKFVFSKKTKVWGKAKGILDMDYTGDSDMALSQDVKGYDPSAPVIAIDRSGQPIPLRGTTVDVAEFSSYLARSGKQVTPGTFYYLADDGAGSFIPVRLNIEHLSKEVFDAGNSDRVVKVSEWRDGMHDLLADFSRRYSQNPSADSVSAMNDELHSHVAELAKLVDIHDIYFSLGVGPNGYLQVYVNWKNLSKTDYDKAVAEGKQEDYIKNIKTYSIESDRAVDTATDKIFGELLRSKHSFQINLGSRDRAASDFEDLFGQGYVMVNLKQHPVEGTDKTTASILPKNVDMYMEAWDKDANTFVSEEYQKELMEKEQQAAAPVQPVTPFPAPTALTQSTPIINDEEEPEDGGGFGFQIVGSRPSVPSRIESDKDIQKKRKAFKAKLEAEASPLYRQLQLANSVNMNMSEAKLKDKLKRVGLSTPVIRFLTEGLKANPSLRNLTPYEAFIELTRMMDYDLQKEYNKSIKEKIDSELEDYLIKFLEPFGIRIKRADLRKVFKRGDVDIAGAFDVLEKTIWLADNPEQRNKLTMPEEFAHAFVELMGSSIEYGADSSDFKFLYNTVTTSGLYEQVYETYKDVYKDEDGNPDEYRIRKEAIGQALASAIVHNWNEKKLGKTSENKTFWNQLKDWFERILDLFRGSHITFDKTIDTIAKEVLAGDTHRLKKVDDTGFILLDYEKTLAQQNELDGGKAVEFMRYFSSIGNVITGSLAYRQQGTVFRGRLDSLHDIDMIVPQSVHQIDRVGILAKYNFRTRHNDAFVNDILSIPYFQKVKERYPKLRFGGVFNNGQYITINSVYSEDPTLSERFLSLTGSYADRLSQFTEDERKQLYLFDFFLKDDDEGAEQFDLARGINYAGFKTPFREKLRLGRAKDVYDYQMWKTYQEYTSSGPNPMDTLFQITSPDRQQEAIDRHRDSVSAVLAGGDSSNKVAREVAGPVISVVSQGPKKAEQFRKALMDQNKDRAGIVDQQRNFAFLFNSLVTEDEKSQLASAVSDIYGSPANEVDMFDVMQDYNNWMYTRVLPSGNKDSVKVLESVFKKIEAVQNQRDALLVSFNRIQSVVGEKRERTNGEDIGMINELDNFRVLPSSIKEILKKQGITPDEYNRSSKEMQDKILRCAGV